MSRKIISYAAVVIGLIAASLAVAGPAQASLSQCDQTYVCAWTNASYGGNFMEWQPSAVWSAPGHCLNFNATVMQDAISSLKSNNGAPNFQVWFYHDINCNGANGAYPLNGTAAVANLKGTGHNDSFSSIGKFDCC
jgi:hypothetical protein